MASLLVELLLDTAIEEECDMGILFSFLNNKLLD